MLTITYQNAHLVPATNVRLWLNNSLFQECLKRTSAAIGDNLDRSSEAKSPFLREFVFQIVLTNLQAPPVTEEKLLKATNVGGDTETFRKFLCALCNRPYTIQSPQELKDLAALADYYCALPILSATLASGLVSSPMFRCLDLYQEDGFVASAAELIHVAKKLRHPILFRSGLCILLGTGPPTTNTWWDLTLSKMTLFLPARYESIQPIVCYLLGCQPDHFAFKCSLSFCHKEWGAYEPR